MYKVFFMQEFILKPKNYNTWSRQAIKKIQLTIDSCKNDLHLASAKKMIDNFIIVTAIMVDGHEDEIQDISRQLWLNLKIKQSIINGSK